MSVAWEVPLCTHRKDCDQQWNNGCARARYTLWLTCMATSRFKSRFVAIYPPDFGLFLCHPQQLKTDKSLIWWFYSIHTYLKNCGTLVTIESFSPGLTAFDKETKEFFLFCFVLYVHMMKGRYCSNSELHNLLKVLRSKLYILLVTETLCQYRQSA